MSTRQTTICQNRAKSRLDAMLGFANDGLMIPEQVWDRKETPKIVDRQYVPELKFGEGTGSATPLAWSMAQFIRLATNLKAGKNLDTPQIVYDRYKNGIPALVSDAGGTDVELILRPLKPGETIKFPRKTQPKTKLAYQINGESRVVEADEKGNATIEFKMPSEDAVGILGIAAPDGATAFERVTLRLKPKTQEFSPALIEKIKAATTSPFVENGKAVMFYRGQAASVSVAGDMTTWNPGRIFMQKVADDLQAVQIDAAKSARFEYKFIVDGKWIADPLNPNKLDNGVGGENSFFTMPGYKPTPWIATGRDEKGSGGAQSPDSYDFPSTGGQPIDPTRLKELPPNLKFLEILHMGPKFESFDLNSKIWNDTRKITVYIPLIMGTEPKPLLPVLYFEDGGDYLKRAKAIEIQQNLVAAGKVKPFIMVFLDPKDRNKEYWANDKWADFVANEVLPEIDKRYRTIKSRDGRALLGASLGGVTSLWIGLKHPDVFSRLGGQSSSFWIDNGRVVKALEKLDPATTKFRFYLDDGTFEGTDDTRRVNVMLRGKGYDVTYVEGETGHNWTAWHDRLADAFIALWK